MVEDAKGEKEALEFWDIGPGGRTPVWRISRLRRGPITYRLDRIQVL